MNKKRIITMLFVVYLFCVVNFIMIKFFGDIEVLQERINNTIEQRNEGYYNISLYPLKTISSAINSFNRTQSFGLAMNFFIGNIIAFVPFGLFIPLIFKKRFLMSVLIYFIFIVFIEVFQFISCLGIADIDDLLLNMLGCIIGYSIYFLIVKFYRTYAVYEFK